jgi:hypothetical protein
LPAIQFILAVRLIPILTHLSSRWTVPLKLILCCSREVMKVKQDNKNKLASYLQAGFIIR